MKPLFAKSRFFGTLRYGYGIKEEVYNMFCEHCGREVDNDSCFCQHCGETVTPVRSKAAGSAVALGAWLRGFWGKKKNRSVFLAAVVAVVAVIAAVVAVATMPQTVILDNYIAVRFEGLSTYGTAHLEVDEKGLLAALGKDKSPAEAEILEEILEKAEFSLRLDNTTDLSNGDKVYIDFSCNGDFLEAFDLRIRLKRDVRIVEGLREPEYLDLFAQLKLTYVGCAPYGEVRLINDSDNAFIRSSVTYSVKEDLQLSEGSKFTVQANFSGAAALQAGYIITETTKEYTATGLPQPQRLNVFDCVRVEFSGVEGEGKATYKLEEEMEFLGELRFVFNKDSDLKEGDVITLSYTNPYNLDPLKYGYTLNDSTAKQYTVTKLGSKVTAFSQISADEQAKLLKKVDNLARYYLSKGDGENGLQQIQLVDTGFANGNELSHAVGTSNITLHQVLSGQTGSRYPTRYLIFVYNLDISGHPNITRNNGNVADACVYFYIKDAVLTGDGMLDIDYEAGGDIVCKTACYLNFAALDEAFLKSLTIQEIYEPSK